MSNKMEVKILGVVFSMFLGSLLIPLWGLAIGKPMDGLTEKMLLSYMLGLMSVDWFIALGLFVMTVVFSVRGKYHIVIANIIVLTLWILFEKNIFVNYENMAAILFLVSIVVLADLIYSVIYVFENSLRATKAS